MSHSHPHGPPTRPASWYGLPIDPVKGESTVSVGPPQRIHISFLRPHSPYARMCPTQFLELKKEIGEYSFISLLRVQRQSSIFDFSQKLRPIYGKRHLQLISMLAYEHIQVLFKRCANLANLFTIFNTHIPNTHLCILSIATETIHIPM
jgi:hypothetical protein